MTKLFNSSSSKLVNAKLDSILAVSSKGVDFDTFFKKVEKRTLAKLERVALKSDNSHPLFLEIYASMLTGENQEKLVRIWVQDVTARETTIAAYQKNEMLRNRVEQLGKFGYWERDMQTGKGVWSDELYRILGLDPEEHDTSLKTFFKLVEPEDLGKVKKAIENAMSGTIDSTIDVQYRINCPDGTQKNIHGFARMFENEHTGNRNFVGILHDITESKREEERFSSVLEALPVATVIVNETGRITMVNKEAEKIFGYDRDEMSGQHIEVLLPERYRVGHRSHRAGFFVEQRSRMMGEGLDLFARHKDGYEFPIEVALRPLEINGQKIVLSAIVDITERKRAEEERAKLESRLRQQQKLESIGTLAGGVAHEINNPINGIMNYAQLIDDRLDPQSPLREYAGEIVRESRRVAKIVLNLLTFARQDKEPHSPAKISDNVNDTLTLIRTIIRGDQITLDVDVPDDLPKIKCRSQQIQQVLMNLLTNGRDALNLRYPEHDPDKIMKVTARTFEKEGRTWVRTTVEDHGAGIPDKIRGRVFDPFFTTKDRTKGTGLGLSISHGIVRDHNGELTFECEAGQYTRFHLDLPTDNGWTFEGEQK